MNLINKKMDMMGGPSGSEKKAERILEKHERRRNRISSKIQKAGPKRQQKLRERISSDVTDVTEKLSNIKKAGKEIGQYQEEWLKSQTQPTRQILETPMKKPRIMPTT